jgi:alkylation response protein AidB-like acyl-CoA dehydrogenase
VDFALSDTQRALRDSARALLRQPAFSHTSALDAEEKGIGVCEEGWASIVDVGWSAIELPSAHGGAGGDLMDAAIVLREIGRTGLSAPLCLQLAVIGVIFRIGAEAGARELLGRVAESSETVALVNPPSPAQLPRLSFSGGNGMRLSGTPQTVEWGANASILLVPCLTTERSSDSSAGADSGVSLVVIDMPCAGSAVTPARAIDNEPLGLIKLENVVVEEHQLLTPQPLPREAWLAARRTVQLHRAFELTGVMERTLELTTQYVTGRHAFGRPIGSFQSVQHGLADMALDVRSATFAADAAAWWASVGQPSARAEHVAIYAAGSGGERVAVSGAQYHGAIGFTREYPLELYFRRAKGQKLRLGSMDEHLAAIGAIGLAQERPSGLGLTVR